MLFLGIDLGTSSIKVSVVDGATQQCICAVQYPDTEVPIISKKSGWAEQDPGEWWQNVQHAIKRAISSGKFDANDIAAIGIAYQMHGLVIVDSRQNLLRDAIIWCDSRAVEIGNAAFHQIGEERSLSRLLNSPGNFTASKLAWVKENEPAVYARIDKIMLPGDFIAMKLTGEITTTSSALSEGIFWDFETEELSNDILACFGFDKTVIPGIRPVFSSHGYVSKAVAAQLSLPAGIPVTYKAGDQPNNALSLNVFEPGEVAATAGTSGVIYGISDQLTYDPQSRVNSFAHVNHQTEKKRLGVLLCINGTGILNRWMKNMIGAGLDYPAINKLAAQSPAGSDGIQIFPFGNGAERMLGNKIAGAQLLNIDFNIHTKQQLFRAAQEGIVYSFRYGLDIMRESGMKPHLIRAGKSNMFLSPLFVEAFANVTNCVVELYNTDGSLGAALGAALGLGYYKNASDAFSKMEKLSMVEPMKEKREEYEPLYLSWNERLKKLLEEQ